MNCIDCNQELEPDNIARCNDCKAKLAPPRVRSTSWEANKKRIMEGLVRLGKQKKEEDERLIREAKSTLF